MRGPSHDYRLQKISGRVDARMAVRERPRRASNHHFWLQSNRWSQCFPHFLRIPYHFFRYQLSVYPKPSFWVFFGTFRTWLPGFNHEFSLLMHKGEVTQTALLIM
jgi:hypothetical protein